MQPQYWLPAAKAMTNDSEQSAVLSADANKSASTTGVVSRIRNYFLTGLVVAGPVAVTAWLIWWFVTWVDNLVRPVIPVAYRPETYLPFNIPGLGLIIVLLALTLLGFLTANLVGSRLVSFGENILSRMPIVRPIYRTTKQIFETLFSASESSFRNVGLVEFPAPGMWSLVFLTQPPSPQISAHLPAKRACVGVPALHAEPYDRILLLRAAARCGRSRHHGRAGHDAPDLRRHYAAGRRSTKQADRNGRNRPRCAGGA